MTNLLTFLRMAAAQQIGRQTLARTPEPIAVIDAAEHVAQYNQVMSTKLAIAYAAGLTAVHRARPEDPAGRAVDLACGPGHYTLCLTRFLPYREALGIDLAPRMVQSAVRNAEQQGLTSRAEFRVGDVNALYELPSGEFGLACFTDAAHHMPGLETVGHVLKEMDRITAPDGLVMAMDLVRLRTAAITERYVELLGEDYHRRGLPDFFDDFRNSMYAAWTADELRTAIPVDSQRYWCQIVPRFLPTIQIILGLPVGRRQLFLRSGFPWQTSEHPVSAEIRREWELLQMSLRYARRRWTPPGR